MDSPSTNDLIADLIECECCGLVRDANSKVWRLSGDIENDFPACPTCIIDAEEAVTKSGGAANDLIAICAQLETWSKDQSKRR